MDYTPPMQDTVERQTDAEYAIGEMMAALYAVTGDGEELTNEEFEALSRIVYGRMPNSIDTERES